MPRTDRMKDEDSDYETENYKHDDTNDSDDVLQL